MNGIIHLTQRDIEMIASLLGKKRGHIAADTGYAKEYFLKKYKTGISLKMAERIYKTYGIDIDLVIKLRELQNYFDEKTGFKYK